MCKIGKVNEGMFMNKYKTNRIYILYSFVTFIIICLSLYYIIELKPRQTNQNIIINRCLYQKNDVVIYYPQFKDFVEEEKQQLINDLVLSDITKITSEVYANLSPNICINMDYELKFLSQKIISIFYTGVYGISTPGEGLNSIAMATTIDIENGTKLVLKDIVGSMEDLSKLLLDDTFESITTWEGIKGTGKISREYMGCENMLLQNLQMDSFDICNHNIEWYIEGENFVFVSLFGSSYEEYAIKITTVQEIFDENFVALLEL